MPRTKITEGVKWQIIGIRDAVMKQFDIARSLNKSEIIASRLLKKHKETCTVKERKRFTLIFECKGLLLKRYGMWFIFLRPRAAVKVNRTFNSQKYRNKILESNVRPSGTPQNARTWCSQMTKQDLTVLASSRNTKTYRSSLAFHGRACLRT